jgi:hypothetical protein
LDLNRLKELVTSLSELSTRIKDCLDDVSTQTYDAKNAADNAQSYANDAMNCAELAESNVDEARSDMDNIISTVEEIEALFEGEAIAITDVPTLIRRYKQQVLHLKGQGCLGDEIAERLSISPVIVNIILERGKDAA